MAAFKYIYLAALLAGGILPRHAQAQEPPLDLRNIQTVTNLQAKLSNPDFQIRQESQHLLERLPPEKIPDLTQWAASATDLEVKARLLAAIDAIEEHAAIDPPPISLHIQNATLEELATALTRATGANFTVRLPSNLANRFTLNVADQPFWEVHRQLNAQHPIWFANPTLTAPGLVVQLDPISWRQSSITHGFALFIENFRRVALPPAGAAAAASRPDFSTVLGLGVDPRIRIIEVGSPDFTWVVDEAGTHWTFATSSLKTAVVPGAAITLSRTINVTAPPTHGKTLTAISGSLPVTVALEEAHEKIANAAPPLNVPITVGNSQIVFTDFTLTNPQLHIGVKNTPRPGKETLIGVHPELLRVSLSLIDNAGHVVWSRSYATGTTTVTSAIAAPGPLTLILTTTVRAKEIKIPFEFKDLPLPN